MEIGELIARYPQHAKLFWCEFIHDNGVRSIYSVKCDEDHDDGWNICGAVCHMHDTFRARAIVDAHNTCVVAALSLGYVPTMSD